MCFYIFKIPLINKTGGSDINETIPTQEFNSRYSLYEFGRIEFPEVKVDFLLLDKDACFKDFLSVEMISRGILMNVKTLELFLRMRLPKHKVYPFKVKNSKGEIRDYYLLHFSNERFLNFENNLDFSNSLATIGRIGRENTDIKINSFTEFREYQKKLRGFESIQFKAIKIKDISSLKTDIFLVPMFNTNWIITKRLRDLLVENNLTGVELIKTNLIY